METFLVFLFIGTGLLPLTLLKPVLRQRTNPGATGLLLACVGTVFWGLSNGVFLLAPTEQAGFAIWTIRIAATSMAVLGWVLTVTEYLGLVQVTPKLIVSLSLIPATGQVFAWTNEYHHLHYGAETGFLAVETVVTNYGPVFYGNVVYLYTLLTAGAALLMVSLFQHHRVQRIQRVILLGSILPPLALNIIHLVVLQSVDLTSFGLVLTMFMLGWALFYGELLEVVPVARERLVSEMVDPVITLNSNDIVVDSNPPARELCGVDGPATGLPSEEFLSDFPALLSADGTEQTTVEVSKTDNGETRYFDVRQSPVYGPSDDTLGRLIVFREITNRKRKAAALKEKNQRLDEFASFVSHDLHNPIQVASGHAALAKETGDLDHIDPIEDSLDRMESMITDLRMLTQADRESIDPTWLDLETITREAWQQVETGPAHLSVESDCQIAAERKLLLHVFENLIRNAVEHGQSETAEVRIVIECLPDGFAVSDDGPGIPESKRDQILEHGYTTSREGTGIGLSIVRTVADAHGWSIAITDSQWGGARFEFSTVDIRHSSTCNNPPSEKNP